MEIVFLGVGVVLGIVIGFFLGKRKPVDYEANQQDQQLLQAVQQEVHQLKSELKKADELKNDAEKNAAVIEQRLENAKENFSEQRQRIKELTDKNESLILENRSLSNAIAEFKTNNAALEQQKKELEEIKEKFTKEFELIATQLLKKNTTELSETNQKRLGEILFPFKDQIDKFEKKVHEAFDKEFRDKASLKAEIKNLFDLSQKLSTDAENLTNALKNDSKKQGNWGEIILERVLERSGLIKGQEYDTQYSTENEEGNVIRPDVVIQLPDNKHVIVDAKVSLTAYESFINSSDEQQRELALKAHLTSVKNHVKDLSSKNYQTGVGINAPDFVLLFMPIESAFSLAVQHDNELFSFAWEKRIVIVSPSTLLATLRTIASIWKHERQNQNVMEIARLGGDIHDKLARTMDELQKIDLDFEKMHGNYKSAFKRLYTGKGNVIRTAQKMSELGAKTQRKLSVNDTDEALEK